MKCCICNNKNIGEFITINDNKYHLCCIEQLKEQRQEFKKWVSDYRYNKTGSNEDGRYCVAISVTDVLNKLNELEGKNE
jgi:hypothetical protein